jgi:curved DNA-binding protein CbpA
MDAQNYYEFLQISPKAEPDTIHRVYKFLAARYHPDNGETGDAGKFYLLKQAYDVLSDPEKRAKYDSGFETEPAQPDPLSTSVDFMDKIDGELNRRWAFLALLYIQRRTNPSSPEVPLKEGTPPANSTVDGSGVSRGRLLCQFCGVGHRG